MVAREKYLDHITKHIQVYKIICYFFNIANIIYIKVFYSKSHKMYIDFDIYFTQQKLTRVFFKDLVLYSYNYF